MRYLHVRIEKLLFSSTCDDQLTHCIMRAGEENIEARCRGGTFYVFWKRRGYGIVYL